MTKLEIAPSILPADFGQLGPTLQDLQAAGVDRVHWDVMDGVFVPNLTVGAPVIESCRRWSDLPFEAHLMIVEPDRHVESYVRAGCELVIIHAEATTHLHRSLGLIRSLGARAGVALNPSTPPSAIEYVMDLLDVILVMTVNPGFGGQRYLTSVEPKIASLAALRDLTNPTTRIEVDGGVAPDTLAGVVANGGEIVVSGSALFSYPGGLRAGVEAFHAIAEEATK